MANTTNNHSFAKFGDFFFGRQAPVLGAKTHPGLLTSLAKGFDAWRERRAAAAELSRLSDRDLADIGITRQEIPDILANKG
jgi:uncharacterized protein YjiS (DUF1127 family)